MFFSLPGAEVVEDHDLVAVLDEPVGEVGSDEAGPACYQHAHIWALPGLMPVHRQGSDASVIAASDVAQGK